MEAMPQTWQILVRADLEAPNLTAAPELPAGARLFVEADALNARLQDEVNGCGGDVWLKVFGTALPQSDRKCRW